MREKNGKRSEEKSKVLQHQLCNLSAFRAEALSIRFFLRFILRALRSLKKNKGISNSTSFSLQNVAAMEGTFMNKDELLLEESLP